MVHPNKKKIDRLAYIRGLLRMYGIRNRDIAKQLGISESVVGHVLAGRKKSHRVQKTIAEKLEMPFEDVWGTPE